MRARVPQDTAMCPKCGTSLAGPKAVGFLRYGRRWSLLVFGVFLILWPVLLFYGVLVAQHLFARVSPPRPSNMRQQTTAAILQYVATSLDESWGWQELEYRLQRGDLSQTDIDQAIDGVIAFMRSSAPQGYDTPIHWADNVLKPAYLAGAIDNNRVASLLDAFTAPTRASKTAFGA